MVCVPLRIYAKKLLFPQLSELVITNERLLLRAGSRFTSWVSNDNIEIEIAAKDEFASFSLRPKGHNFSPAKVYVKSVSPFREGKQLADFLSYHGYQCSLKSYAGGVANLCDAYDGEIQKGTAAGTTSSAKVPPGIAVTHAFLTHQLRSIVSAIPLPSFSAIDLTVPRLPVEGETSDLGAIGYQFGVDRD
ncbi:MAG: hypothetical protein WC714_13860 [Candidatus Obscuribacterales bacterium]|jgi:hypothetical protein